MVGCVAVAARSRSARPRKSRLRSSPTSMGCDSSRHSGTAQVQPSAVARMRPSVSARQSAFSQPDSHQSGISARASLAEEFRFGAFSFRCGDDAGGDVVRRREAREIFRASDRAGQPIVRPFSDGSVPGVSGIFFAFDSEVALHPDERGRFQHRLNRAHAHRKNLVRRGAQSEIVFARGFERATRIIGDTRLQNARSVG